MLMTSQYLKIIKILGISTIRRHFLVQHFLFTNKKELFWNYIHLIVYSLFLTTTSSDRWSRLLKQIKITYILWSNMRLVYCTASYEHEVLTRYYDYFALGKNTIKALETLGITSKKYALMTYQLVESALPKHALLARDDIFLLLDYQSPLMFSV